MVFLSELVYYLLILLISGVLAFAGLVIGKHLRLSKKKKG